MSAIYDFIVSKGTLTPEHREELKTKRGFSDETIAANKFFSGGKHLLSIEQELVSSFAREALMESGVCVDDGKGICLTPILFEPRIIIPYLDKKNECYLLRPHKLGLKNVPVHVYQEKNINNRAVILTEGEFKAVAGCQMGIASIAIPGISSFSDKHFDKLEKMLSEAHVKDICIIFDNEVKDDPQIKERYKENPEHRYDTQYYAYYMARTLTKAGFITRIKVLPEAWMRNGKVDIDGALAQGKTRDDILSLPSYDAGDYLKTFSKDVQSIINRKIARRYCKENIRVEFGRYVATRKVGKIEIPEVISNFTIRILATRETPEGTIREATLISDTGEHSPSFSLESAPMSDAGIFRTFCLSRGNFIWRGKTEDLLHLWEPMFLESDGRHIIEPDHIGWIESEKMWLFGNIALPAEGHEMRPDGNHTFWTDRKGIKPIALGVTSGRQVISEGIPYLAMESSAPSIAEIHKKLGDTIGVNYSAMALGWVTSVPWMEEVFELYGCFPFLFITGRRGSGKSTIAEWLTNMFGLENSGKMASDTTAVGLQRYLAYYSCLPVFVDEYRNTKQITMKNGMLRNVYNRQSAGKGIKADFGIREAKIRGTLIIAGEELPEDNALLTRCLAIRVSDVERPENHFNWFMKHRSQLSSHILTTIRKKKTSTPTFINVLNESKLHFVSQGMDDRSAINYAVVVAGYFIAFGNSPDFGTWITNEAIAQKQEYEQEQAVDVFFDDLLFLKSAKKLEEGFVDYEDGKIYLYYHGLYNLWSAEYFKVRGEHGFKASAIRGYMKDEPGFLHTSVDHRMPPTGANRSCLVFDHDTAPKQLQQLVEGPPIQKTW